MKTRNTSAVWLEKYQRWQVNVTNDAGDRKTFSSKTPGRKGQTECNRKADVWLASNASGPDKRCDRLIDEWLKDVALHTGTSNYNQRKSIAENWIKPCIGSIKFSRLGKKALQDVIDRAYTAGKSKKHLENIRGALSSWLKSCPDTGYMRLTTAEIVIPADAPVKEKQILQPEDLAKLFGIQTTVVRKKTVPEWYVHAWRLAVVTGYRPGEIVALERKHWNKNVLLVRGAVNDLQEHTSGKNDNSVRDTVLPQIAIDILNEQDAMLRKYGMVSVYLFPTETGECSNQQTMRKHWLRFCKVNGIHRITPYEIRHTFVSVTSGRTDITLADLKALVGHSKNMDTLGVYGHKISDADKAIADKIDTAFTGIIK